MKIRKVEQSDLDAIISIYNSVINDEVSTLDLRKTGLFKWRQWFQEQSNKGYAMYVAEVDGAVVGVAYFSAYRPKDAFSSSVEIDIYVRSEYRNRGIGSALAETILEDAKNNKKLHIIVSVINTDNDVSTHMEEKYGFILAGTVPEVAKKFGKFHGIQYFYCVIDHE